MAKYFFYLFLIFLVLIGLEIFQVYDVPYLEIPDWFTGTKDVLQHSTDKLDKVD